LFWAGIYCNKFLRKIQVLGYLRWTGQCNCPLSLNLEEGKGQLHYYPRSLGTARPRSAKEKNRIFFLLDLQNDPAHYKGPVFWGQIQESLPGVGVNFLRNG
jgi:hypothetical protein